MRRTSVTDAALAAALLGLTVAILGTGGFGTPDAAARELDLPGVLLAAAATLPIAFWRLAPGLAYGTAAGAALLLLGLRYPLDAPIAAVAAAYLLGLAYSGAPSAVRRRGAQLAVGAFVPLAAAAYALGGVRVSGILPELAGLALLFAGTWIAADRSRLRRERVAEAEERAARLERELEREARLAVAEERTRIARELHDSAGHAITVILVQAGAARLLHARDPERSLRALGTIEDVARGTVGEIDRLVRALRDDEAPPAGGPDLDALLDRHRAAGLRITGSVPAVPRSLPASVGWAAYRILQEALTNAARHGTGAACVDLRYGADAVELLVTNPVRQGTRRGLPGGHGIVGMRERATLLGGDFSAGVEGAEFRVSTRLPYGEPAAPPAGLDEVAGRMP